jgi:hypothetical protein
VFPHPPAAGAAAGGRGNRRNRRRRGEQEGGFRNRLSALFTGRGWVQVPFALFLLLHIWAFFRCICPGNCLGELYFFQMLI